MPTNFEIIDVLFLANITAGQAAYQAAAMSSQNLSQRTQSVTEQPSGPGSGGNGSRRRG